MRKLLQTLGLALERRRSGVTHKVPPLTAGARRAGPVQHGPSPPVIAKSSAAVGCGAAAETHTHAQSSLTADAASSSHRGRLTGNTIWAASLGTTARTHAPPNAEGPNLKTGTPFERLTSE